ncbi:Rieske (2Fe-2S) protein [Crateriforma conspicua]|uniref:Assimilatory nitrite reductase [NAD(P)H] small subunit n=1 Tax=Crateriforma conspicua TaxID=2527996 RepID=A0A5C5Y5U4_9PLAN|nr:Rieske (2Fe-2S) protein [Crateriforma conspicua]QDV64203.1 Assimilatory nitrite reductase [NAD(P)H] small subunit [Crateriforma conspicua]TWT69595.1 Assimilatory nitrite reductase [NAD(P)H] small subunit [Crateriforma conspicua]
MKPSETQQSDDSWTDVLASSDLPDASAKEVVFGDCVVAIFRVDGRLYALDGLCAHQGGPIAEGHVGHDVDGNPCVTCPWHGWQYEMATGIQVVNRQPLQRCIGVREVAGRIQLRANLT